MSQHFQKTAGTSLGKFGKLYLCCICQYLLWSWPTWGQDSSAWNTIDFEESLVKIHRYTLGDYTYRLYQLNPFINRWFILEVNSPTHTQRFHLENPTMSKSVQLHKAGLLISKRFGISHTCVLWDKKGPNFISSKLKQHANPYYSICGNELFMRLHRSSETKLSMTEWSTSLLRKTSFGESIINIVKPIAVQLSAETIEDEDTQRKNVQMDILKKGAHLRPPPIRRKLQSAATLNPDSHSLGIEPAQKSKDIYLGHWYPTKMYNDIYVSLFLPNMIPGALQDAQAKNLWPMLEKEDSSLVYAVAYDLSNYGVRYISGTTQPLTSNSIRKFGRANFLRKYVVRVGNVPPFDILDSVAVFIGGFKTRHSTIQQGPHKGKTYGFVEGGVSLSPLQPGLATLHTNVDHQVNISAWPASLEQHQQMRKTTESARQNGVLILENGHPTTLVKSWRGGNWSADVHGMRQSLRSGVCTATNGSKRDFLIFFAFTLSTPSTMARVMQSYGCRNAMHLDMNALMYLHNAIYAVNEKSEIKIQYLHKEMLYPPKLKRHRYILDNNLRDFFYVYRK
ncbi:MAG: hypothetical protein OXT67_03255 [Zetaproteobacteria bacterium]|nr:hypothetical protein [Zetaproteobacteria bacterium]